MDKKVLFVGAAILFLASLAPAPVGGNGTFAASMVLMWLGFAQE